MKKSHKLVIRFLVVVLAIAGGGVLNSLTPPTVIAQSITPAMDLLYLFSRTNLFYQQITNNQQQITNNQ
jgi:hypothetical protein